LTCPRFALEGTELDEFEELELEVDAKCSLEGAELDELEELELDVDVKSLLE